MSRTPGPWTRRHTDASAFSSCWWIEGPECCVAKVMLAEDEEANAEFIVRACNAHDDLLAACIAINKGLDHRLGPSHAVMDQLDAAIAKGTEPEEI